MAEPYDPQAVETKWQRRWAEQGAYQVDNDDPRPAVLRALHVPLPERAGPPGPRPQLHLRRPARAPAHHAGPRRAEPDRLRQLRAARRERRHQDRHPPPHLHRRPHRGAQVQPEAAGGRLRLASGDPQPRPAVHAVEPGHLPAVPGGRPGLPQERPGQLVPGLPDRPGQRAGAARRHLRAQRRRGRQAGSRAVVLPDHRLRRRAAGRPGRPGVAGAGQDHAAQLDRPLRGRRVRPAGRGRATRPSGCSPPGRTRRSA